MPAIAHTHQDNQPNPQQLAGYERAVSGAFLSVIAVIILYHCLAATLDWLLGIFPNKEP
jgi:hypothetical protein